MGYEQSKSKNSESAFVRPCVAATTASQGPSAGPASPGAPRAVRSAAKRRRAERPRRGGTLGLLPEHAHTEQIKNKCDLVKTFSQRRGLSLALRGFFED